MLILGTILIRCIRFLENSLCSPLLVAFDEGKAALERYTVPGCTWYLVGGLVISRKGGKK